jgi:hypothetical protein
VVSSELFTQIRKEQEQSVLNQSETWLKSDSYRQDKRAAAKDKLPSKLKKNVKEQINS